MLFSTFKHVRPIHNISCSSLTQYRMGKLHRNMKVTEKKKKEVSILPSYFHKSNTVKRYFLFFCLVRTHSCQSILIGV